MFFSHQSCNTYKISSNSTSSVVFTTMSRGWGVVQSTNIQPQNFWINKSHKTKSRKKKNYKTAQHTKLSQVHQSLSSLHLKELLFGQLLLSPFTVPFIPPNRDWKVRTFPFEQALFTRLFTLRKASLWNFFCFE